MKFNQRIILVFCFLVHLMSPTLALGDFKVYSEQQFQSFEAGLNIRESEKGVKFIIKSEGASLKHAICSGFREISTYLNTKTDGNKTFSNTNVAGLRVTVEDFISGEKLVRKVTVKDPEHYVTCISEYYDKTNGSTVSSQYIEESFSPTGELDLTQTSKDENCSYQLLEHGYFPSDDWSQVLLGFKCKSMN